MRSEQHVLPQEFATICLAMFINAPLCVISSLRCPKPEGPTLYFLWGLGRRLCDCLQQIVPNSCRTTPLPYLSSVLAAISAGANPQFDMHCAGAVSGFTTYTPVPFGMDAFTLRPTLFVARRVAYSLEPT